MSVTLRILRLPHGEGLPLPAYQSDHAAGFDLVWLIVTWDGIEPMPGVYNGAYLGRVCEHPDRHEYDTSSVRSVAFGGSPSADELQRRAGIAVHQMRRQEATQDDAAGLGGHGTPGVLG